MKTRNRYNKYRLSTKCRICLTQSPTAVSLELPLQENATIEEQDGPLIHDALEQVMGVKINLGTEYPSNICRMCLGLLKISYHLKLQFLDSQKTLQQCLTPTIETETKENNQISFENVENKPEISSSNGDKNKNKRSSDKKTNCYTKSEGDQTGYKKHSVAPVELLVGTKKYDISDVVIVENDASSDELMPCEFKGFLNNLGKSVSARIIKRNQGSISSTQERVKRIELEEPSVLIEKISKTLLEKPITVVKRELTVVKPEHEFYVENVEDIDKYIIDNQTRVKEGLFQRVVKGQLSQADIELGPQELKLEDEEHRGAGEEQTFNNAQIRSAMRLQYKCPYCKKLYSSKNRVMIHLSVCVKARGPLLCSVCQKEFKNTRTLAAHIRNHHQNKIEKIKARKKFKCEECGKILRTSGSFWYHKMKHRGKQHTCETCGRTFYTKGMLATHRDAAHGKQETRVLCPVCGKGFHYKSGLFYHMKQHTNERKYLCEFCDRKFYALNSLKRHSRTHTGDRPYACKFCDKMFFSLGEVKKHELLHTGYRPFQCDLCGKGFITAHNKKVHMVVHSGDLMCTYCDRTFINLESLTYHLRNRHKIAMEDQDENEEDYKNSQNPFRKHKRADLEGKTISAQTRVVNVRKRSLEGINCENYSFNYGKGESSKKKDVDFLYREPLEHELDENEVTHSEKYRKEDVEEVNQELYEIEEELGQETIQEEQVDDVSEGSYREEEGEIVEMLVGDEEEIEMEDHIQGDVDDVVFVDMDPEDEEETGHIELIEEDGTHVRFV